MIMAFDSLGFLRLARNLADRDGDEAEFRTALGRAYYALFLIAREKTAISGRRNVHNRVINALRQRRTYRVAADQLDVLRRLRVVADYELLPVDQDQRDWRSNWARAQALVDRILPRLQAW